MVDFLFELYKDGRLSELKEGTSLKPFYSFGDQDYAELILVRVFEKMRQPKQGAFLDASDFGQPPKKKNKKRSSYAY